MKYQKALMSCDGNLTDDVPGSDPDPERRRRPTSAAPKHFRFPEPLRRQLVAPDVHHVAEDRLADEATGEAEGLS